ncbi:MAG: magnesium transporter CorA family protein [Chloroflexi bacterium]|nr:magnesium transporter CorA family protein [Chloroflexota bacterium]
MPTNQKAPLRPDPGHGPQRAPAERRDAHPATSQASGGTRIALRTPDGLRESNDIDHLRAALDAPDTWAWVDVVSSGADGVAEIAQLLGLHPLIVEDISEGNQRAKIEVTDNLVHVVMFAVPDGESLNTVEVDFVLAKRFLLSVHREGWEPRSVHHLREGLVGPMARGPDHLLWALVDGIVDAYFPTMDRIGDEIDALEDDVITEASRSALARLFGLKRDLLALRRAISPVREIFNQLTNRDLALIDDEEIIYFRDVYDHLIRLTDELDTHRELVSSTLEVYLTTVNNNLSLIMKRLTGVTVILAGVGAVAGIFGMSEAAAAIGGGEGGGFWIVTALTFVAAALAAIFLRRIGWI